jgi:riboflavin synthase
MFTGIIQDVGEISAIAKTGDWLITVKTAKLPLTGMALGASVACNGVCLTVIEKGDRQFKVQVSAETLSRTTALHWKTGGRINLEPALKVGDELGGHIVSGHVDGIARVRSRKADGESVRYVFEVPPEFAKFVASKGSIALDGISLTVNEVDKTSFGVNIIPHTQVETTFGTLEAGGEVNFEVDLMARYAARLMDPKAAG